MNPFTLALDCSLGGLSVALGGGPLKTPVTHTDTLPRASDTLHTVLQDILAAHQLTLKEVAQVAVTVGPGSFTGIRLGLAVAHGLKAVSPQVEITGLPTLAVMARQLAAAERPAAPFTIFTDAAGQMVYVQPFSAAGDALEPPACLSQEEALGTLPQGTLLAAPATLLLARDTDITLPPLDPLLLLAAAEDTTLHVPPAPLYVKPLAYRKQGEA